MISFASSLYLVQGDAAVGGSACDPHTPHNAEAGESISMQLCGLWLTVASCASSHMYTHNLEVTDDLTPLHSVCAVHPDGRETECRLHTAGSRFSCLTRNIGSAGLVKIAIYLCIYIAVRLSLYIFNC